MTNIKLKLYNNAIADAELSLRLDEDHIRALLLLAKAQFLNGNLEDYESTIAEAKIRHPDQKDFIKGKLKFVYFSYLNDSLDFLEFVEKLKTEANEEEN